MTVKLGKYHLSHYLTCDYKFTLPFTKQEYQEWWTYTTYFTTWRKWYRPKFFSSFGAKMALTPKLLNQKVPKQHDTYSLPWQTFWICTSLLVGKCAIIAHLPTNKEVFFCCINQLWMDYLKVISHYIFSTKLMESFGSSTDFTFTLLNNSFYLNHNQFLLWRQHFVINLKFWLPLQRF